MKELFTPQVWIIMILGNCLLFSCKERVKKYWWEPAISAPKYYPIAGKVDFGNAGYGSDFTFDTGWGDDYGGIVSSDRYKEIPKEVYIDYYSVVDGLRFEGKMPLPQEKLEKLFKKYPTENWLLVGMAPGGWIRVWFETYDTDEEDYINIEIIKGKLEGHIDENVGVVTKDYETWGDAYTYWQLHGIPYEAWAENEKEYDIVLLDIEKTNPQYKITSLEYTSLDGTYYFFVPFDTVFKAKLPADMEIHWESKKTGILYDTHLTIPKNINKIIEKRNPQKIILRLAIEEDDQHAIIYINTGGKEEKLLRFKNHPIYSNSDDTPLGKSGFTKEIEYFIK